MRPPCRRQCSAPPSLRCWQRSACMLAVAGARWHSAYCGKRASSCRALIPPRHAYGYAAPATAKHGRCCLATTKMPPRFNYQDAACMHPLRSFKAEHALIFLGMFALLPRQWSLAQEARNPYFLSYHHRVLIRHTLLINNLQSVHLLGAFSECVYHQTNLHPPGYGTTRCETEISWASNRHKECFWGLLPQRRAASLRLAWQ
mmetsp:Transcript_34094/g.101386  ORF Transcript_34094/g.101386 Transcript_34094/m.101386 type:complete len:202 (+) Transcript_34094:1031-1636(+)|eukprot:273917-Chlamydomonas_euryale.AAC.2